MNKEEDEWMNWWIRIITWKNKSTILLLTVFVKPSWLKVSTFFGSFWRTNQIHVIMYLLKKKLFTWQLKQQNQNTQK